MTELLDSEPGATPLTNDDLDALIPTYITTRGQLNAAEQANILHAESWAFTRRRGADAILSEDFVRRLHRRMFADVWRWAGMFRDRETNIGVDPRDIRVEVRKLLDDARAWIEFDSYGRDEIAIRFSHRIVSIHLFRNGNGRHSRMTADMIAAGLGGERFTWGSATLAQAGDARTRYIEALRAADRHDVALLLAFART